MRRLLLSVILGVAIAPLTTFAQPATPPAAATATSPQELIARISKKLQSGSRSEESLRGELAELQSLIAELRAEDPEGAAKLMFGHGLLYLQVFGDQERGVAILRQLQTDFAGTPPAAAVGQVLEEIRQREEAERAKAAVVGQAAPELTFNWASQDGLQTLSSLKNKVVVLDFWATWCGPCVASFPQIKELTERYRGFPVEVIGVTSLQGRVFGLESQPIDCRNDAAKEMELMSQYIKAKDLTWTIAFSEENVFNPKYGVTGIPHMAIVGPDGVVRHNGIHPGALSLKEKSEMIDSLLREAGLPTPQPL